jgi:hypothetical protein
MSYINMLIKSVLFLFVAACSSTPENQKFESSIERAIGKENYSFLESADRVSVMEVAREGKDGYKIVSEEQFLTPEQVIVIRSYFLNDSSYQFERRKKCIFVPEYAFKFQGKNKETVVLVSYSCPQVKFLLNQHAVVIDHDPISAKMEALTKSILNK